MEKQFSRIATPESSIYYLMDTWDYLNLNPKFQREGSIWPRKKQQLFIDSILCGFDIPKFYFRSVGKIEQVEGKPRYIRYEVVDGKQRLLAIKDFVEGEYTIPSDSRAFQSGCNNYDGGSSEEISYIDLQQDYPNLYTQLGSYHLDVICLKDVDDETADEFFLRLNSGIALNAQEKRNGFSCAFGDEIKQLVENDAFMNSLKPRPRFKNDEILVKLFAIALQHTDEHRLRDTKKRTLDRMYRVSENSNEPTFSKEKVQCIKGDVQPTLDIFKKVFGKEDMLLRSLGNISVFFYAALLEADLWRKRSDEINGLLEKFENARSNIRNEDPSKLSDSELNAYHLYETYNSCVQSTNDGSAIKKRAQYVNAWIAVSGEQESFVRKVESLVHDGLIDSDASEIDEKGPSDAI